MALERSLHDPGLLTRAKLALHMSQQEVGELLGFSRRTILRWEAGRNGPTIEGWHTLARHAYPINRAMAEEIARETGETLVSLGLEMPPPPDPPPPSPPQAPPRPVPSLNDLADSVVCAAAEAASTTPQAMRPAILAAFDRAASVGLTLDEVREALRPAKASRPR